MDTDQFVELKAALYVIQNADRAGDYETRNRFVIGAVFVALGAGLVAGFRIDLQEPDWPAAFIELPTGQVSWHLPQHGVAYDGHTTDEKNGRIDAFRK